LEKPIYFKGLNGVRAIAACIVIIWHIDQFSYLFDLPKLGFSENGMAGYGVNMFFVLSGFLITFLLLKEKQTNSIIRVKQFYMRRILRIWPLYYLALLIAIIFVITKLISEPSSFGSSILLYSLLSANFAYALGISISVITPLWSVGVEEQFYLIWPHFISRFNKIQRSLIWFIVAYLTFKFGIYYSLGPKSISYEIIGLLKFDLMAFGGLGAYWLFNKHTRILNVLFRKEVEVLAWIVLLWSIIFQPLHLFSIIDSELNSIFYLIIILNVSSNIRPLISLDSIIFNFFGRISYGLYVYHMIVIYALAALNKNTQFISNHVYLQITVLLTTIIISSLSYKYFETIFLKKKHRFSIVQSTNLKNNDQ
jgi:peptidoglycan/LPS O-acetylase OafA/YrhL